MSLDRDLLEQAKHLCKREHKRPKQASLRRAVSSALSSADIKIVATTFVKLQKERHRADYSLSTRFTRSEVQQLLRLTERAFQRWRASRNTPDAGLLLAALAFYGQFPGS